MDVPRVIGARKYISLSFSFLESYICIILYYRCCRTQISISRWSRTARTEHTQKRNAKTHWPNEFEAMTGIERTERVHVRDRRHWDRYVGEDDDAKYEWRKKNVPKYTQSEK